jgi:hypothetical protein
MNTLMTVFFYTSAILGSLAITLGTLGIVFWIYGWMVDQYTLTQGIRRSVNAYIWHKPEIDRILIDSGYAKKHNLFPLRSK